MKPSELEQDAYYDDENGERFTVVQRNTVNKYIVISYVERKTGRIKIVNFDDDREFTNLPETSTVTAHEFIKSVVNQFFKNNVKMEHTDGSTKIYDFMQNKIMTMDKSEWDRVARYLD